LAALRPEPLGRIAQAARDAAAFPAAALDASARQRAALAATRHRPWPVPKRAWLMGQTWLDLLFAHWPVEPRLLEPVVPPQLPLDVRDGSAWIGVTPFRVEGLRLRRTLPAPLLSSFLEVNVRTYVTVQGKPGIYFFSLDASSRLAVAAARRSYRLPYHAAHVEAAHEDGAIRLRSKRTSGDAPAAELDCRYTPRGEPRPAAPGSLEHFLTERYCLYTLDQRGRVHRGEIHHPPWPLRAAEARITANTMTLPVGIRLEGEPLLHFAERQDVVLWQIEPV
jgi:uncharacterized protein